MDWVVDTCVLLDILDEIPPFAETAAHKAWYEHILRKRSGTEKKRPIADVMIGAYAMRKGGLITRNEADFKTLYPSLTIFNPLSSAS